MDDLKENFTSNWISGTSGNGVSSMHNIDSMVDRIILYMDSTNPENANIKRFSVTIGTDSQRHGRNKYKFSTSISIRRMIDDEHGKGGIYFVKNEYTDIAGPPRSTQILSQKIIQEAVYTTVVAQMISERILNRAIEVDENLLNMIDVHIHFDVSEDGGSNIALGTVRGLASGTGFDYSIKPLAWGASSVANKHSK